ncbi:MAG: tRNA-dihydrouridine synthase family protein [Treponema sp.]|nr:tRNA-dihydrouridine synthase family protein [Treponema sp.]
MKLILAPMATVSHEAFRRTVERFGGCDEYFTEMIHAPSLLHKGPFEYSYLMNQSAPEKMVWQLTSSDAESLAQAALIVAQKGGIGVDINMGCSAPQIYKTGAGIAWMTKPLEQTRLAVRGVKQALNQHEKETGNHLRLSVKFRLGKEDWTEKSFFDFTDMLSEEGVELFTLHARTQKEKYRTLPRYQMVEQLALRYPDIQVILNGCIQDIPSAQYAASLAPHAQGLMIARTAAQKPWIFAQLSQPDLAGTRKLDAQKLALDFIADVEDCQPKEFHKTRLQRFFSYYCQNFTFGHYFATQMLNAKDNDDSRNRITDYFTRQSDDRWVTW